ncbi:MAG: radical SAM protein [Flavisolibacter sp.]
MAQSLYHTFQRYRTLRTHRITALPIVILMPHSACNCRCVMCDIWKGNRNLKQLNESDIVPLLSAFKKYGTRQVVMSGGEALLNPDFFKLCALLKEHDICITLLSTGITLKQNADQLIQFTDDVIVSIDGPKPVHDFIRNINGAFEKLESGVKEIRARKASFIITGRSVIHRLNYKFLPETIAAAKEIGLQSISFLPADTTSSAFNRETQWTEERQSEIVLREEDLDQLDQIIEDIIRDNATDFVNHFIVESPGKMRNIVQFYRAVHGQASFPYKKCNAPWVSAVIEPDGSVRPCFFHNSIGNIREHSLDEILNGNAAMQFRKQLDMDNNDTCRKCVCSLNLSPFTALQ